MTKISDYLKEDSKNSSWQNKAIKSFIDLEPVNKTRFAEISGIINNLVSGLDESIKLVNSKVEIGKSTYDTIDKLSKESVNFSHVNKSFLHDIQYSQSKNITKKYKRNELTEFIQKVYDARVAWYEIKEMANVHREKFKDKIITRDSKPKKPITLKDFIPIYNIPELVVKQLERIESELYDNFYDHNVIWLNRLITEYSDKSMEETRYRKMSLDFKNLLKLVAGTLKSIENKDEIISLKAKRYARSTTDFIVCRMFSKFKNINFNLSVTPEFIYNAESAGSTHFTIRINNIYEDDLDAFLFLNFSMIINRSIYNKLFNQFPTKLYLRKNGQNKQITHF